MNRRIVVAIYIDPDFYPPTINAILNLAEVYDKVEVVTRNNSLTDFPFPHNITLNKLGRFVTLKDTEIKGTIYKVLTFIRFTFTLLQKSFKKDTRCILLYDPIPLFSFYLIRLFLNRQKRVWYHNHDMPNINLVRKYAIGWFATKYEKKALGYVDYFSLLSEDRRKYYEQACKQTMTFIIPNYPSLKVYQNISPRVKEANVTRIIFQGAIGEGHALEELIPLLKEKIAGCELRLILEGPVRDAYANKLNVLAQHNKVENRMSWLGIGPYLELPAITSSCDIGIAIHMNLDDVSKTLGTASNKIYEYAACGLPVILFDSEQFRKNLAHFPWAFFSDGSRRSLQETISKIISNHYEENSQAARNAFINGLNFEKYFKVAMGKIVNAN